MSKCFMPECFDIFHIFFQRNTHILESNTHATINTLIYNTSHALYKVSYVGTLCEKVTK